VDQLARGRGGALAGTAEDALDQCVDAFGAERAAALARDGELGDDAAVGDGLHHPLAPVGGGCGEDQHAVDWPAGGEKFVELAAVVAKGCDAEPALGAHAADCIERPAAPMPRTSPWRRLAISFQRRRR
jgi:hypothetical protein